MKSGRVIYTTHFSCKLKLNSVLKGCCSGTHGIQGLCCGEIDFNAREIHRKAV